MSRDLNTVKLLIANVKLSAFSIFFFFTISVSGVCSEKIDSLKTELNKVVQDSTKVKLLDKLAREYIKIDPDSSEYYINEAIDLAGHIKDFPTQIKSILYKAYFYSKKEEHDLAISIAHEALDLASTLDNKERQYLSHNTLGYIYANSGQHKLATNHKIKALSLAEKIFTDPNKIVTAMTNLMISLRGQGEIDHAYTILLRAQDYLECEELSVATRARVYENIRNVLIYKEEYQEALAYTEKCYELRVEEGDVERQIAELYSMGNLNVTLNKFDNANEKLIQGLNLLNENNLNIYRPNIIYFIGYSNFRLQRYDEAIDYFILLRKTAEELDNIFYLAEAHYHLGEVYRLVNKPRLARTELEEGAKLYGRRLNSDKYPITKLEMMKIYRSLSEIDSVLYNFGSSLKYYKLYAAYKDSVKNEEMIESVNQLEIQYETAKKNEKISYLKAENVYQLTSINQQKRLTWASWIGLLFLLLLLAILYNRYKLKKRSNAIIASKSKENEMLVKEMHHRVKNNLQIMLSLLNTQSNMIENETALALISESQNRLKSIALIHENLYLSQNFVMVEVQSYLNELSHLVIDSFKERENEIVLKTNIRKERIRMTIAVLLGLILNELITNAVKYAFKHVENALLVVNFQKTTNSDEFLLQVIDNGNGIPENLKANNSSSFGLNLVRGLTKQLNGHLDINTESGTRYDIYIQDVER